MSGVLCCNANQSLYLCSCQNQLSSALEWNFHRLWFIFNSIASRIKMDQSMVSFKMDYMYYYKRSLKKGQSSVRYQSVQPCYTSLQFSLKQRWIIMLVTRDQGHRLGLRQRGRTWQGAIIYLTWNDADGLMRPEKNRPLIPSYSFFFKGL